MPGALLASRGPAALVKLRSPRDCCSRGSGRSVAGQATVAASPRPLRQLGDSGLHVSDVCLVRALLDFGRRSRDNPCSFTYHCAVSGRVSAKLGYVYYQSVLLFNFARLVFTKLPSAQLYNFVCSNQSGHMTLGWCSSLYGGKSSPVCDERGGR